MTYKIMEEIAMLRALLYPFGDIFCGNSAQHANRAGLLREFQDPSP